MKQSVVFLVSQIFSSQADDCFSHSSCLDNGNNVLEILPTATPSSCQSACQSSPSCRYFTHYNSEVAPRLADNCFLFSSCPETNTSCRGCLSGPRDCNLTCSLPEPSGGRWLCHRNTTRPGDFVKCYYACTGRLESSSCLSGSWDRDLRAEARFRCPCTRPPPGLGDLECSNVPAKDSYYPGDTICR